MVPFSQEVFGGLTNYAILAWSEYMNEDNLREEVTTALRTLTGKKHRICQVVILIEE